MMGQSAYKPGRRSFLAISLGAGAYFVPGMGKSAPLSGNYVIDTPAVTAKSPAAAFLEKITRAGARLVAVGEHGLIIYSDDNGNSWTQAVVPVSCTLTCVAFATASLGWAAGHFGVILNTTDGGKTWTLQLNGIQVIQLTSQAAQDPALQTSNLPAAPLAARRADAFAAAGPNKPFLAILIIDPQKILVFGAYRMTVLSVDGGKSWSDWSLHIYDKLSHNLYAVATAPSGIYVVGESGYIFETTDGGNSFLPVTQTGDSTLFGVLAADDGSLITYGVAGNCYRSTDKASSWTAVNLGTQDNLTAGCKLSSNKILIASEAGALFLSKDHGASFVAVEGSPTPVFDLVEASDKAILFVGSTGVSLASATSLDI